MREFAGFLALLAWVAVISVAAVAIEHVLDRMGYTRHPPGKGGVPPLPEG